MWIPYKSYRLAHQFLSIPEAQIALLWGSFEWSETKGADVLSHLWRPRLSPSGVSVCRRPHQKVAADPMGTQPRPLRKGICEPLFLRGWTWGSRRLSEVSMWAITSESCVLIVNVAIDW